MDADAAFRLGRQLASSTAPAPHRSSAADNQNRNQFSFRAGSNSKPLQLFDGNAAGPAAGYYNYTGNNNNHLSVTNQGSRNANIGGGDGNQLKLQMSLNNHHHQEERAARLPPHVGNASAVSTGLRLSYEDDERNSSVTSGCGSMSSLPPDMSFADGLMAQMDKENKEMSRYLRIQAEQIGKEMKEANQRHLISLLANLERAVGKKLRDKELEAEAMNRKSKELNEQIRKVAMEVQSWQSAAMYNQSVANNLKSRIMQVAAQNANLNREGSGDSEEVNAASIQNVNAPPGGFFQSSVIGSSSMTVGLGACRSCAGKEASVLVMPCRHLCLCLDCERNADVCPVCRFPKSGSVEINMS